MSLAKNVKNVKKIKEKEKTEMRDYIEGGLEALSWVRHLLKEKKAEEALKEVEDAIETILKGVAIDFRMRIEVED